MPPPSPPPPHLPLVRARRAPLRARFVERQNRFVAVVTLAGGERAEVAHGRSRFDFALDGALVEVKSATLLAGGAARFPDAVTARGARHCDELGRLAERGVPVRL